MTTGRRNISDTINYGVLAGAAGGLAEIAWVSLYASVSGGNAATLARGVTTAVGVSVLLPAAPVTVGIVVHMLLAILLGVALAGVWQALARSSSVNSRYALSLAALVAVWVMNFFVVLPVISPEFVQLVPYAVSLMSKLLFGLAAAEILRRGEVPDEVRVLTVMATNKKRHPGA